MLLCNCAQMAEPDGNMPKRKNRPMTVRPPGACCNAAIFYALADTSGRHHSIDQLLNCCYLPKNPCLGKRSYAGIVIAKLLAQHFLRMLA